MMVKYNFDKKIKHEIKTLYKYNNFNGIKSLIQDFTIVVFAIYLSESNLLWYPLTLLLIGSRQRALATILHEAAHLTLCKNRSLNQILGTYFSGYLVFQTWGAYKKSHVVDHHTKLGDSNIDPDYKHYIDSGIYQKKTRWSFIKEYLLKPILCLKIHTTIYYLVRNRMGKANGQSEILPMTFTVATFAILGSAFVGWKFFLVYWLIPYLTAFQIITWFIELAEHYPLVKYAEVDLYATRNRFSHPVEGFFTSMHGENFHLVHHLFPAIPF